MTFERFSFAIVEFVVDLPDSLRQGKTKTKKMKLLKPLLFTILFVASALTVTYKTELTQLYHTIRLFHQDVIVENFSNLPSIADHKVIPRAGVVDEFLYDLADLPEQFEHRDKLLSTADWLKDTNATALLVVQGQTIRFEQYLQNTGPKDKRISWSVAKSFLSALFGVAVANGDIEDLDAAVTDYVPQLNGSGYEGVSIRNVLQMSSGIYFDEDYADFFSDINRLGRVLALGGSFDEFAASLHSHQPQGAQMHYVSIDTHVIGMVLRAATGLSIEEYFYRHLWSKLQTEEDAIYITDSLGEPMVLGGLNIITRDYARFGKLYRDYGQLNGEQIIPRDWIIESMQTPSEHLVAKRRGDGSVKFGYGYQWWLPLDADDEFMAIGIYGQFIYVDRKSDLVIVKNSADTRFLENNYESKEKAVSAFRAISRHFSAWQAEN